MQLYEQSQIPSLNNIHNTAFTVFSVNVDEDTYER